MLQNLISTGIISPGQFGLTQLLNQAAQVLKISPDRIEGIERWENVLWVNIKHDLAVFVSYRSLPLWIEKGLEAIERCSDREALNKLGQIFNTEVQKYGKQYDQRDVQKWRDAWAKKRDRLKIEEESLKAARAKEEAAKEWKEHWMFILGRCESIESLKYLALEIEAQSKKFLDAPEAIAAVNKFCDKRWEELVW
jgi:hypothetical protein